MLRKKKWKVVLALVREQEGAVQNGQFAGAGRRAKVQESAAGGGVEGFEPAVGHGVKAGVGGDRADLGGAHGGFDAEADARFFEHAAHSGAVPQEPAV